MNPSKKQFYVLQIFLALIFFLSNAHAQVRINGGSTSYSTIDSAIAAAPVGSTINVGPGIYDEDVLVNKTVQIIGSGIDVSFVRGVKASINKQTATFLVLAGYVEISGFTITRNGNNVAEWNAGLNTEGILLMKNASGVSIKNNKIMGNKIGINMYNSSYDTIRNNIIDFNRTGIQIQRNIDSARNGSEIVSNQISNNWTCGIKWESGAGTGNDVYYSSRNKIINNWYSQLENYDTSGVIKSLSNNWLGANPPTTAVSPTSIEPDYANQIPTAYGGNAVPPAAGAVSIRAYSTEALKRVMYTPYYSDSAMTTLNGNVTINGGSTSYSTINSAIAAAPVGSTINVGPGIYDEDVLVDKTVQIIGSGIDVSFVRGVKASINPQGATFLVTANSVVISSFTITRNGNNVAEWNDGLDTAGILLMNTAHVSVTNNKITGNNIGINLLNSSPDSLSNNIIDFNRTGMLIQGRPSNSARLSFYTNQISNNWTCGIKWEKSFKGNINFNYSQGNKIINNWYSQLENYDTSRQTKNCSNNWLGANPPTTAISPTPIEPNYANQIPAAYGGNAVPPTTGAVSIRAYSTEALKRVVYTPYYSDSAMTTLASIIDTATVTAPITIGSTTVTSTIPAGVTVSSAPNTYWNGVINPPSPATNSGVPPYGFRVGTTVIEVGSPSTTLYLSSPATLTLTGVNGPVGYSAPGTNIWTIIADTCGGTYISPANPIDPKGECTITNGIDTKILTYHFTRFGSFIEQFKVSIPPTFALASGTDANTVYIGYAPASHITLTAQPKYGSGNYSFLWSNGATTASITVAPTTASSYTVTVNDTHDGGSLSASVLVNVVDVRCGNKNDKVLIYKVGAGESFDEQNLCVSSNSVSAHLRNGYNLGISNSSSTNTNTTNNNSISSYDRTTLELSKNQTIDEIPVDKLTVRVSPNPSSVYFNINIRSNSNKIVRMIILDEIGRVVEINENILPNGTLQIGGKYSKGIYIAHILQGNERVTVKLVKGSK